MGLEAEVASPWRPGERGSWGANAVSASGDTRGRPDLPRAAPRARVRACDVPLAKFFPILKSGSEEYLALLSDPQIVAASN